MKLEFKPEDFVYSMDRQVDNRAIKSAEWANKRLAEMLSSATVVYGTKGVPHNDEKWIFAEDQAMQDTHKALLINIEPIVKECVKHEPDWYHYRDTNDLKCKHCGVELVAKWEEKNND